MTRTAREFAISVNAERYIDDMNSSFPDVGTEFINTYGAKGPMVFVDCHRNPLYVLTDRKDSGYPNAGIRGKLVLRGGNWKKPEDATPMDVWHRQLTEETQRKPIMSMRNVSIDADRRLRDAALSGAIIHADYFTAVPGELVGNPKLPYPWYCDVVSVVGAEIPLELLDDIFKIPFSGRTLDGYREKLDMVSPESTQWLTAVDELVHGNHVQFGFGDDYKVRDFMKDIYGIDVRMLFAGGINVVKLDTNAEVPFDEREYLDCYFRSDNNPLKRGRLEGGRVFMGRGEPETNP